MERIDKTLTSAGAIDPALLGTSPRAQADAVDEVDLIPVRTFGQLVRQRFMQHRLAVIALVILAVLITIAVVVPLLTGNQYQLTNLRKLNLSASLEAPLGYTDNGQNLALRLARGTQTSLIVGFAAVLIISFIGVTIGAIAGFFGGWVDNLLMRLVDIVLSLPAFFIILMVVGFFGRGDIRVVVIAIGIAGWTLAARLVRAEFLALREADYVQAARALGASRRRIAVRHMLPAALAPIVVAAALGVADSVVLEASLSFLGLGIQAPEASLGNMITNAQELLFKNPERVFYPTFVLVLIVLCASFLGDGLRDALDPRQRIASK